MEQPYNERTYWIIAPFLCFLGMIITMIWGCTPNKEHRLNDARASYAKGAAFYNAGHYTDALQAFRTTAEIYEDMRSDSAAGDCWTMVARSWQQLGAYDSSLANYEHALRWFESTGTKKLERQGKITLAQFYQYIGDAAAALQLSLDVHVSARIEDDLADVYPSLEVAAGSYHELGDFEQEISTLDQMIVLDSMLNAGKSRYALSNAKITAFEMMGQHGAASLEYQNSVQEAASSGHDTSLVRLHYTWGELQQRAHHPDSALRAFSLAVSTMDRNMDPVLRIHVLSSLGALAYRARQFDNAHMYFSDARDIAKGTEPETYLNLLDGMILVCDWKTSGIRSSASAQDYLNRASTIFSACDRIDFLPGEAMMLLVQSMMKIRTGDSSGIRTLNAHAIDIIFQNPELFTTDRLESEFLNLVFEGERSDWCDPLLSIECASGDIQSVFNCIERQRQQGIDDFFSHLHIRTRNDRLNREITEYRRWRLMNHRLKMDLFHEQAKGEKRNLERVQLLRMQATEDSLRLRAALNAIARENKNYSWLLSDVPPDLRQIRDSLGPTTALLEFIPVQECLYILLIERDTVYLCKSEYSKTRFQEILQDYRKLFSDPHLSDANSQVYDYTINSRLAGLTDVLGQVLLQPIVPMLNSVRSIEIVPSLEMGMVPIHILNVNGKPIADQYSISYLPAASAVLFDERAEAPVRFVGAFGHSGHTGWDVDYELRDIRSFYDSAQIFTGPQVTFETIRNATYDALHLALEFIIDTDVPDRSSFYISDGHTSYGLARISLGDALQIPVPDVLIISNLAGQIGTMNDYIPLAFLANGVPNVITTQWQGSRREKRYFGEVFYTAMKAGLIPPEAYNDAMHAVKKKNEFSGAHRWGLYYRFGK